MKQIELVRGMRDLLPTATPLWRRVEDIARDCFAAYGYDEIRLPVVEKKVLFERQLGEHTDLVEKEMYSFAAGDDELVLRPEATVSTMRAVLSGGLHRKGLLRLWYGGPMFRRERPQKGRYRQFYQLGAEAVGSDSWAIDAEQIIMSARLWRNLGVGKRLCLHINNLGNTDERRGYRERLREHFRRFDSVLDETTRRRIDTNPLRILDSKDESARAAIAKAPRLSAALGDDSRRHGERVKNAVAAAGVDFEENETLVRGLDYYNLTVFEWVLSDDERRQNAVCGGGRYDGLAEQIGGPSLPGCGFALGLDRLVDLAAQCGLNADGRLQCYMAVMGDDNAAFADTVAEDLRNAGLSVWRHVGGGNLARQLKKANAGAATLALLIGDEERTNQEVTIKRLSDGCQQRAPLKLAALQIKEMMNNG